MLKESAAAFALCFALTASGLALSQPSGADASGSSRPGAAKPQAASGTLSGIVVNLGNGSPLAGVEIAPLGYETVLSLSPDPSSGVRVGWLQIEGEAAVDVEVLFSIRNASSGVLNTSTSIIPGPTVMEASFIAFAATGSNTGVALLNPPSNGDEAVVELIFFDRLGRPVGETEIRLVPGAQTARFLTEVVGGLQDFAGTFELRSSVPVSVLPLRQDGIELTTQVVHPGRVVGR